jgi:predicted dehydrogenase
MDMGLHCIDLLKMFIGEVNEVFAFTDRTTFGYAVEDTSVVALKFGNRANGVVDNFFSIPDDASQNRLEIYGTKGCILTEGTIGQNSTGSLKLYAQQGGMGYEDDQKREPAGVRMSEIAPTPINVYRAEIEHFLGCIVKGEEPLNSGHEAIMDQMIVETAYESSRTGRKIALNIR